MPTLAFASASSQYAGFGTLGSPLDVLFAGPHSIGALCRQSAAGAFRQMVQGANAARTTAYGGIGFSSTNASVYDATRLSVTGGVAWTSTTDWTFEVITFHTADTPDAIFYRRNQTTDSAFVAANASGSPAYAAGAPGATGFMQIGRWLTSDYFGGEIAFVFAFGVRLTALQVAELAANEQTSDIWNCSAGNPLWLVECNVAESSLTNIGSASAVKIVPTAAPTLTGGDPPRWNFNGRGGAAPTPPPPKRPYASPQWHARQRAATWCKRSRGILVPDLWTPSPVGG